MDNHNHYKQKRSQNKTKTTKIRPKKTIWVIFLICLGLFTLVFIATSSYFKINEYKIYGNNQISDQKIISIVEEQRLNYWLLNKDQLHENLKEVHWIDEVVKLTKDFPNTVQIEISERKETAVISANKQDQFYTLASDLVVLDKIDENSNEFPEITGIVADFGEIRRGENLYQNESETTTEIFNAINDYEIDNIDEIQFTETTSEEKEIVLYLHNGSKVKMGYLEEIDEKFYALSQLKAELLQADDDYYLDLKVPEYPVLSQQESEDD